MFILCLSLKERECQYRELTRFLATKHRENGAHGGRQGKRSAEGLTGQGESYVRRQAKAIVAASALLLTLALGVTLAGAVAPVVTIDPASSVSYTSAHVSGTVDPQDQETYFYFQYSKDPVNEGWSSGAFQGPIAPGAGVQNVSEDLGGLTPGAEYEVRLVAENFADPAQTTSAEPNPIFTTDPVGAPTVSIDPVTTFTGTSAHFSGSINPNAPGGNPSAFDVNWHFECAPACPGSLSGQVSADSSSHVVEADVTGLEPNTDHEVTLVASNAGGQVGDGPESFKTEGMAPVVQTLYAGELDTSEATLAASINPRNSPAAYQFEWGTNAGYGHVVPAAPVSLGTEDNAFHVVTAQLSGLEPGTPYHFRAVATNSDTSETIHGIDRTFTTLAADSVTGPGLPDGRVYEKVSPVQKNGGDIDRGSGTSLTSGRMAQVSFDGKTVAFASKVNFGGSGAPSYSQYISTRHSDGWSTRGISPRTEPDPQFPSEVSKYIWLSDDLSSGVVRVPHTALNPGDPGNDLDLYLWTGDDDAFSRITVPLVPLAPGALTKSFLPMYDASADGRQIVFGSTVPLAPGPVEAGVYEWAEGELRNVGILPDGTPAEYSAMGNGTAATVSTHAGDNVISDDGSRIFFSTRDGFSGQQQMLAVREEGATTREIAGNPGNKPPVFQAAKPSDGSIAFFTSSAHLTPDATGDTADCGAPGVQVSGCPDLFRWSANAAPGNDLTDLTTADPNGGGVLGVLGISDDATTVYFAATGNLAPGAVRGIPNLYLWREGQGVRHVSALSPVVAAQFYLDAGLWSDALMSEAANGGRGTYGSHPRVTPDGRYILFQSFARITAYDNAGFKQLYIYDSLRDEVRCVSCNPMAPHSGADAYLSILMDNEQAHQGFSPNRLRPRNLSDSGGRVFFDTREALVPGDTNGKVDVYKWEDGRLHLISSGESGSNSTFMGASSNGDDVFFVTAQPLVRSDRDVSLDVYDARVGGVAEPAPLPGCQGDECQGTPMAAPGFANPGTSSLTGPGNSASRSKKKRHRSKKKQHGKHRRKHQERRDQAASRSTGRAG